MSENELNVKLLNNINSIASYLSPERIFVDMDKAGNGIYNYFYILANEIARGLELFYNATQIQAYSQAIVLWRQLIEQVAILKLISSSEDQLKSYAKFMRIKFRMIKDTQPKDGDTIKAYKEFIKIDPEIKELATQHNLKNPNYSFLDFGWIVEDKHTFKIENVLEKAGFSDLIPWRQNSNLFVHLTITVSQFGSHMLKIINHYIYLVGVITDHLMCIYHQKTQSDFVENNINYRDIFTKTFEQLTIIRNQNL